VLGLQRSDIYWQRATAEIQRIYRRGAFDQPKSASSRRTVELPKDLLLELDLVCPSVRGKPMQGSALLERGLHPALNRAGIWRILFHNLRQSFASNLLAADVDIVTSQRRSAMRTLTSR